MPIYWHSSKRKGPFRGPQFRLKNKTKQINLEQIVTNRDVVHSYNHRVGTTGEIIFIGQVGGT